MARPLAVPDPFQEESPDGRSNRAELAAARACHARRLVTRARCPSRRAGAGNRRGDRRDCASTAGDRGVPGHRRGSGLQFTSRVRDGLESPRSVTGPNGWSRLPASETSYPSITSFPASRLQACLRRVLARSSRRSSRRCEWAAASPRFSTSTRTGSRSAASVRQTLTREMGSRPDRALVLGNLPPALVLRWRKHR